MTDFFEPGSKCICSENELYNAFGDKSEMLVKGERLRVKDRKRISGSLFLSFEEHEETNYFISTAFTPIRALN